MSTSSAMVITNFFGMHVNAANVGVGLTNSDGSYNVSGTVIGVGQTAQSAVDFALNGSGRLATALPWAGGVLGLLGVLESYDNINTSFNDGNSPAQSDIAGVVGGVAAVAGGAALILGGGVIVPVSVVVGVAAGSWQLVASAKGWTLDDMGFPVQQALSDAQKQEVAQALTNFQAQPEFTDAMGNYLGGTVDPVNANTLWGNAQAFEPLGELGKAIETAVETALATLEKAGESATQAIAKVTQALKDVLPTLASGDPYSGDPFTGLPWAGQSYETLLTNLETRFQLAEVTRSPLVLDLDGDGVETTASSKTGVHFDLDKSGFAEQAGWAGKDDGLLVRDLNGDGKITHGGELFGNHTVLKSGSQAANGFEALKDLDDNNDGKVDANDSAYASLRVWKDLNSDGITEDGELITLEQAGVQSLNVRYTDQGTGATKDAQGNQHQQLGSYTKADGSTQQMDDVWFSVDTARTVNLNTVAVSDEIAALPELRGMGNVASLRQAMACDESGPDQLIEFTRLETLGQYPAMYLYLKTQVDTAMQAEVSTSVRHEELDIY